MNKCEEIRGGDKKYAKYFEHEKSSYQSTNTLFNPKYDKISKSSHQIFRPERKIYTLDEATKRAEEIQNNKQAVLNMAQFIGMEAAMKYQTRLLTNIQNRTGDK